MAMSLGDSEEVVSEINVTPLVDVMLVLLVVFIVTAHCSPMPSRCSSRRLRRALRPNPNQP